MDRGLISSKITWQEGKALLAEPGERRRTTVFLQRQNEPVGRMLLFNQLCTTRCADSWPGVTVGPAQ